MEETDKFEKEHEQFWNDEITNKHKETPFEQFQCFVEKYRPKNNRNDPFAGSKFSEPFFVKFLNTNFKLSKTKILRCSKKVVKIKFGGKDIPKSFDLRVDANGKTLYFDLKTNLDNIEKDLLKAYIAFEDKDFPKYDGKNAIFLILWEMVDHSAYKRKNDKSAYLTLLEEFRNRKFIYDFAYLTPNTEEAFNAELEKIKNGLHVLANFLF